MNLVCCVAAAVALGVLSACRPLLSEESRVIDSPMRVSFESLGWTEDVLVSADSGPAEVRFLLPDSPVQGDPLWYGARLSYEWTGNPGNPGHADDLGDDAMLIGRWNDHGFYQMGVAPMTDLDEGYEWSMVDMVNGGSHGYEVSPTFAAATTNFAMYKAVQPGWNEVSVFPFLFDASNKDIEVLVKKESEIIATSWRRTFFEAEAHAQIDDEAIHLRLEGENQGWGAPNLAIRAMVFREDRSRNIHSWSQGALDPLSSVDFRETIPNEEDSPIVSVIVELDWASGRQVFQAWPENPRRPWYTWGIFHSSVGSMIALVVVWVGAPMLFRALRDARRARS